MTTKHDDDLIAMLHQQEQKFGGNPLQLEYPAVAAQFIGAQVQIVILAQAKLFGRPNRFWDHGGNPRTGGGHSTQHL